MKIKRIIFPLVSCCLFSVVVDAQTVNFSGQWKRNDVLSDAGGLSPNSVPITVSITQDNKQIAIQSVVRDGKGELHPATDTLYLDGTVKTISRASGTKAEASVKWITATDLLYHRVIYGPDGNSIQDWKETLSIQEGKLEIDVELLNDGESYSLKEVFDK